MSRPGKTGKRGGKERREAPKGRGPRGRGRFVSGNHVATVERRGRVTVAEPLFERGSPVEVRRTKKAPAEGLCFVEFSRGGAKVLRELGRPERARDVAEALVWERLGWSGFRSGLEQRAEEAASAVAADPGPRQDLRDLPTFTVDPATARDFDDAVSARVEGDSIRLWIHIADVAAHVRPGSPLDQEAMNRAMSVYVPGFVEPMLPKELSAGACSLSPGVDRYAVTTEIPLGPGGKPGRPSFYRSVVRSDKRLDYERLDRIFLGREQAPDEVAEPIDVARRAAAQLAEEPSEAALEINTYEPEFEFDSEGHVTASHAVSGTEAHRLIERLMVLTNEMVAQEVERADIPTLYRVHERPDPERAEELVSRLAELGVPTPPVPDPLEPSQAAALLGQISRHVASAVEREGRGHKAFTVLLLRTLKQARYSDLNIGHAGLGSESYCHFTSPIRRYPDLVAHRALLSLVGAEEAHQRGTLEEVGVHCSARERDAIQVERDADDICAAFLLERELRERGERPAFEGEIAGLVGGGAFVAFAGELGEMYEGFLPAARIGDDWFELDATETTLIGERTGARVRLGDPVSVEVERVEPVRGRVTLSPVTDRG